MVSHMQPLFHLNCSQMIDYGQTHLLLYNVYFRHNRMQNWIVVALLGDLHSIIIKSSQLYGCRIQLARVMPKIMMNAELAVQKLYLATRKTVNVFCITLTQEKQSLYCIIYIQLVTACISECSYYNQLLIICHLIIGHINLHIQQVE